MITVYENDKTNDDEKSKEGIKQGKAEGLAEGIKEGAKQEKIAIAKDMKSDGLPIATIAKYTGLTAEEIEKL